MKKIYLITFLIISIFYYSYGEKNANPNDSISISKVLLIYNSAYKDYLNSYIHIKEYLDHFGVIYDQKDINVSNDVQYTTYNLLLIAHDSIMGNLSSDNINKLKKSIQQALVDSVGLLSFCSSIIDETSYKSCGEMKIVSFSNTKHYITQNHSVDEVLNFKKSIVSCFKNFKNSKVLINVNGIPLLSCLNNRNIAYWSTSLWMSGAYLGQMRGLDDCFLRSIIWTAKKPFFIRGLPPIVTLRIDDAYGTGAIWNKTPFYWVKIANEYKFKPWLGLFIDNMDSESINELKNYTSEGICTSIAHSFKQTDYLYFDHPNAHEFSDTKSINNMKLVDEWYTKSNLTKSTYLVPHFYEIGTTCLEYAYQNWGIKYLGLIVDANKSYWWANKLKMAPYKSGEEDVIGGSANSFSFADYYFSGNCRFFNGLTEIRDWGYDWMPTNDVNTSIQRGVNIISRSLQSMNFAELMTHEENYLKKINPNNWRLILKGITESIAKYNPHYLTIDSAMTVLESTYNSKVKSVYYESGNYRVKFKGNTIASTSLYVYTANFDTVYQKLFEIPIFKDQYEFQFKSSNLILPQIRIIADTASNSSQINISNNPVKDDFSISLPDIDESYDVKFYNIFGNLIYFAKCRNKTYFNTSLFPNAGIYFVRIFSKTNNKVIKIIYNGEA